MKRLFIVRHAKAEKNEKTSDFDRGLNVRVENDAKLMAKVILRTIEDPVVFVSSTAKRALQTALIFKKAIPKAKIIENGELYTGNSSTILQAILSLDEKFSSAFIFGHNPALEDFMGNAVCNARMATTSVACFEVNADSWKEATPQDLRLVFLLRPSLFKKEK